MVIDYMLKTALKMIKTIEDHGFQAYIVGGFVRDYLLGIPSNDVDIATSATPKDLKHLFQDACLSNDDYGSITVIFKNIHFEITTFRKELSYKDNRRPDQIIYIDNLKEDLKRRDFTVNTICMDQKGNIVDLLGGCEDLQKKIIRSVSDPFVLLEEDVLRILRAVRFATTLQFELDDTLKEAIKAKKYLLSRLSLNRKKEELDKIFSGPFAMRGIALLKELGLDKELSLIKIYQVKPCSQVIGIWAMLEVDDIYPFTRNEKTLMEEIRQVLDSPLSFSNLYHYGLYPCVVAAEIKDIDKKKVNEAYLALPIHRRKDLAITTKELLNYLEVKAGPFLKPLYQELEELVLTRQVKNEKELLLEKGKELFGKLERDDNK